MDLGKHASWNDQGEWSWPQPTRPVEIPPVCPYCTLNGTTGETGCTCGYLRQLELQKAKQEGRTADYQDSKVMYHLAPSRRRQKILEEGLRPDADQTMPTGHTPGVYLWDSPETAQRYKSQGLGDSDIWAVRMNDMLPINKDWHVDDLADLDGMADMPEVAEARMQKFPGAHYLTYPIPPENLRLHTPDPWKDPWMMSDQARKLFDIQDQRDTTAKTAADQQALVDYARSLGVHLDPGAESMMEEAGFEAPHFRFEPSTISVPEYMKGMARFTTPEEWYGNDEDAEYVREMSRNLDKLPPALVNGDTNDLMDGSHRLVAHHLAGQPTMPVLRVHHTGPNAYESSAKTAAGQVMYHVAPRRVRESILANGLAPYWGDPNPDPADVAEWDEDYMLSGQDYPPGVHLWNNLEDAGRYRNPQQDDLWEVDASGLPLQPDDWPHDEDEHLRDPSLPNYANSMVHDQLIPPNRLRLLNEGTTAKTAAGQVEIRPAGEDGFLNYLGYMESSGEEAYPRAQIDNAYVNGQIVGSVVYGPDEGKMWVYHIYVKPELRGQGVGRQLMQLVADEARHQGLQIDGDFTDADNTLKGKMQSMSKTAAGQVMYHAAPQSARGSIRYQGLTTNSDGFVHMFHDPALAHDWAGDREDDLGPMDVYEVSGDLPLEQDPHMGNAVVHRGTVPPHHLRLLNEGTTASTHDITSYVKLGAGEWYEGTWYETAPERWRSSQFPEDWGADKNPSLEHPPVMYHGTNQPLTGEMRAGTGGEFPVDKQYVFLYDHPELARAWANRVVENRGGEPHVYEVQAHDLPLLYDVAGSREVGNEDTDYPGSAWAHEGPLALSRARLLSTHDKTSMKVGMAMNPDRWQGLLDQGHVGYHYTTPENVTTIQQHGLRPWDEEGIGSLYTGEPGEQYGGNLEPRPGHVYLSLVDDPSQPRVAVDLRKLDPANINMDEDNAEDFVQHHPEARDALNDVDQTEGNKSYDSQTLGDWAEDWSHVIDQPDVVGDSIDNRLTFAHRGPIPAHAILPAPNDKTSMKLGAVPEGYEIRPMGDTGYFEHEEGKWRPRYYEVKDRNTGEMVRGDRMQTSHGTGDGVVAYYGDDPVGSLTWQEEPHATMIGSAYVHPDHRQQGLFNAMYEYLPQGKPVDAYHWDNPMLRQKVRDRQRQASMKLGGMEHYAEQVPIDWLAPYIEFAREPGAEHFDRPGGSWESLRDDIAQNGIREPLIFEYDPDAGTGYVSEGSTRYSVAKELGLPSLPVLVLRSRERPGRPFVPVTQPGQYLIKDALPGGDFPQYSTPSEIGIPTVGGTTARTAMDWVGDAYPGEDHTEEKTIDKDWTQLQFTEDPKTKVEEHNWIMSGGYVKISDEDFESLMALMGHKDDWKPLAYGTVEAYYNYEMMFHLQKSNIATHLVEKGLKKYCTDHQLKFEGILSADGTFWEDQAKMGAWEPSSPGDGDWENVPEGVAWPHLEDYVNTGEQPDYETHRYWHTVELDPGDLHYDENGQIIADAYINPQEVEHGAWVTVLIPKFKPMDGQVEQINEDGMARIRMARRKIADVPGVGRENPEKLWRMHMIDTQPVDYYGEQDPKIDNEPQGEMICPHCGEICDSYGDFLVHEERAHNNGLGIPDSPQPVVEFDDPMPAHLDTNPDTRTDMTINRQARLGVNIKRWGRCPYCGTEGGKRDLEKRHPQGWYKCPECGRKWDPLIENEYDIGQHVQVTRDAYHGEVPAGSRGVIEDMNQNAHNGLWSYLVSIPRTTPIPEELNEHFNHPQAGEMEYRNWFGPRDLQLVDWSPPDILSDESPGETTFPDTWLSHISAKMPLIPAPIPFIFDIESDKIHSGQPGHKHKDIKPKDKLTVNVVEGLYLPDGKLQFRTDSTMPYTVRYVIRMWYTLYPELEVKQVFKLVGDKKFKLANAKNIGGKVRDVAFTDQAAREAYSVLSNYGDLYVVGGAVRDICLGHLPKDIDLVAAGLRPDQISALLNSLPGQTKIVGEDFPVFEYKAQDGSKVEIALPRTEVSTGESHKEFDVHADPFLPIETDLARRDFTANSMAVNMRTGELIDPYNGQHDLSQGDLKMVDPKNIEQDPLRILRAFTLMSGQGLKPDEKVKKAIEENAYKLRSVSPQRTYMQLDKIFGGRDPESAIRAMRDLGVLHYVMPEVAATIEFDQKNKNHKKTLDEHSLEVLRKVAEESDDPDLRLTSLYHDVGKVHSQWLDDDGNGHYYKKIHKDELTGKPTGEESGAHHEEVGAQMAHDFMTRNRYPDERRDRVVHLIRNHMFHAFEDIKGARKFVDKVSPEHAHDLLTLRNADQEGKGTADEWGTKVPVSLQRQMVQNVLDNEYGENPGMSQGRRPDQVGLANLAVNGKDLIAEGIPATSEMGRILHKLWEAVMDDPSLNNKAFLLEMARNFHQMRDASVHKTAAVPPAPGTIPAPPGSVRLYHYTGAPEGTLEREGIDISKAKGETYGEPNYVWASTQKPDPYTKRFAEFFMPHDDPRWDIGKYTPGMKYQNANGEWEDSPEAWAHHLTSHGSNVTFYGSIRPEEIAAVHEPWHSNYRYMKEGNMSPEELSWIADQRDQFPNEFRAYQELLKDHGRTSSILDPIRDSLDEAVFEHADADMPRLKPKIRHWIKRTIYKVLRDNNYPDPEEWTHLVLTGSLTTYQWSPASDLDVALFLTHPIPDWRRAELISLLLKHIEDVPVPGTTHRLGIYIEPVERKPSDIFRPGLRSAFDIDNDRWIVLPERERVIDLQKEMGNLLTYAKTVAAKMKTLILYDPPGARTYWQQIAERWRRDQTAGKGDYHESNIVYKYLMKHHLSPFLTRNRKPASIEPIGSGVMAARSPLEAETGVRPSAPEWNDDPIEWEAA